MVGGGIAFGGFQKMRRGLFLAAAFAVPLFPAQAGEFVHGYIKSDGSYVEPYYRSSPNSTDLDNYSTKGNVNPYTGAVGTREPDYGLPRVPSPSHRGLNDLNRR